LTAFTGPKAQVARFRQPAMPLLPTEPAAGDFANEQTLNSQTSATRPSRSPYDDRMGSGSATVLVVDDEDIVREVVCAYLEREGYRTLQASAGKAAQAMIASEGPDLIVLDVMLPEIDGYSILADLRARDDVPVILLTARTEETDRLLGLKLGADDYVVKPFSPRELAARVGTVLRRAGRAERREPAPLMEFDGLVIDGRSREVRVDGKVVDLTAREFDLLAFLAAAPKQVFSRSELLEHVWESSTEWQDASTVTVHVRRVRRKIEEDPNEPRWIATVWGVGYRFEP
jgi:DNA-binding response OmpR family regulator